MASAITGVITLLAGYIAARRAGKNAVDASRDTFRQERRELLYLDLLAWGADYLADRPVDPGQVGGVDRDARLAVYASKDVKTCWAKFRAAMEPLGAGHDLLRIIADAQDPPPAGTELQRQKDAASARAEAKKQYTKLLDIIRAELT